MRRRAEDFYIRTIKGATTGGSGVRTPNFCLDPSNFLDNFFLRGSNLGGVRGFISLPIDSIEFVTAGRQFGHVFLLFVVLAILGV
jgi:hypothetical protein